MCREGTGSYPRKRSRPVPHGWLASATFPADHGELRDAERGASLFLPQSEHKPPPLNMFADRMRFAENFSSFHGLKADGGHWQKGNASKEDYRAERKNLFVLWSGTWGRICTPRRGDARGLPGPYNAKKVCVPFRSVESFLPMPQEEQFTSQIIRVVLKQR